MPVLGSILFSFRVQDIKWMGTEVLLTTYIHDCCCKCKPIQKFRHIKNDLRLTQNELISTKAELISTKGNLAETKAELELYLREITQQTKQN